MFAGSIPALGTRLGRQLADHLGLEPGMLWVRVPPGPLRKERCPRGAAWSARHPVKVEAVGSNPIGDACYGAVRQLGRATDFKSPWMWVRLPPVLLDDGPVD